MGKQEKELIRKAQSIYKNIYPVGGRETFNGCFTKYGEKLFLWFDTEDQSTHVVTDELLINGSK